MFSKRPDYEQLAGHDEEEDGYENSIITFDVKEPQEHKLTQEQVASVMKLRSLHESSNSNSTSSHLIQLVGMPPLPEIDLHEAEVDYDSDNVDAMTVHDEQTSSSSSTTPCLGFDKEGRSITDILDSMNEDPFTLETFETLIQNHAKKKKDFLLARVTTIDPNNPKKKYYSHYAAHHLNKVLFRAEPEQGLLHRMRAKNPLNNMVIIGDVYYFVVKAKEISSKLSIVRRRSSLDSLTTFMATSSSSGNNNKKDEDITSTLSDRISDFFKTFVNLTDSSKRKRLHLIMNQDGLDNDIAKSLLITGRRRSADDAFLELFNTPAPLEKLTASTSSTAVLGSIPIDVRSKSNRLVRSKTYMNDSNNTKNNINTQVRKNVNDWISNCIFENEQHESSSCSSSKSKSFLTKPSQRKTPGSGRLAEFQQKKADSFTFKNSNVYTAEYFASDDDFLMKASVRAFFKEHALESDDSILFTICTTKTADGQVVVEERGEPHPALVSRLDIFYFNRFIYFSKYFRYY
jgi:hypothetical protein